jgi:hypothetical protein
MTGAGWLVSAQNSLTAFCKGFKKAAPKFTSGPARMILGGLKSALS